MNAQEFTMGDFHQPSCVHIKTAANLMTGRSKTMELELGLMLYHVTLTEPKETTRLVCVSETGAERIFNNFNIDKE